MHIFIKLGKHVNHDKRMNPVDLGGQNMVETIPLCISSSNIGQIVNHDKRMDPY